MGRPLILNIKFRFALRHYSIQKVTENHIKNWNQLEQGACTSVSHHGSLSWPGGKASHFILQTAAQSRTTFLSRGQPISHSLQPLPWNHFLTRPNSWSVENPNRSYSKIRLLCRLVILYSLFQLVITPRNEMKPNDFRTPLICIVQLYFRNCFFFAPSSVFILKGFNLILLTSRRFLLCSLVVNDISGAPNDDFLQIALGTILRLDRVVLRRSIFWLIFYLFGHSRAGTDPDNSKRGGRDTCQLYRFFFIFLRIL